jgi:hypothetical protein
LNDGVGSAARLEAGLDAATARFARAIRTGAAVSFDTSLPAPERELQSAMRALGVEGAVFAAEGSGATAGAKVSRVLSRLLDRVTGVAHVDTSVEGRLVATTRIGLGGDCTSALVAGGDAELRTHARSLAEQLRLRRAWTRLVLTTGAMAGKLALATGAGTPLLALPAAFRFVRSVIAELRQIDQTA